MKNLFYFDIVHQIVNPILDTRSKSDPEIYHKFVQTLDTMQKAYRGSGTQQYDDFLCRVAYAYRYMASHAFLIEQIFARNTFLSSHFDNVHASNGLVRMCVFGAGPGTELLGIAHWLRSRELPSRQRVDFSMFDIVEEWEKSLEVVVNRIYPIAENKGFVVEGNCFNFYKKSSNLCYFESYEEAYGHDFYIFPYILSEIPDSREMLFTFGRKLSSGIKPGAVFVFIDRAGVDKISNELRIGTHVSQNKSAIINSVGLKTVIKEEAHHMALTDEEWHVVSRSPFSELIAKVDNQYPVKTINAFSSIGVKL